MNPLARAALLGLQRAWIEFKHYLRNMQEIIWTLMISGIFILVLWFQRDNNVGGLSLALLTLPSLLGMSIANGAFSGTAGALSYDREDGTLLRVKAIPQGIVGYLVARILYVLYTTIISMLIIFIPSIFLIDGLLSYVTWMDALTFVWLFILGYLATAPLGAVIGSLVKSSGSGFGLTFLPMAGLVAISGIFYPITAIAGWLQAVAQVFPIYWLGQGARSVFLPDSAAAAELGGAWRLDIAALVLVVWAVIGMAIAPRVLRRMAQRESGSNMEARKQRVMQRGY